MERHGQKQHNQHKQHGPDIHNHENNDKKEEKLDDQNESSLKLPNYNDNINNKNSGKQREIHRHNHPQSRLAAKEKLYQQRLAKQRSRDDQTGQAKNKNKEKDKEKEKKKMKIIRDIRIFKCHSVDLREIDYAFFTNIFSNMEIESVIIDPFSKEYLTFVNLTVLELIDCNINASNCYIISNEILNSDCGTKFQRLIFDNNPLMTDNGIESIVNSLLNGKNNYYFKSNLVYLSFKNCGFGNNPMIWELSVTILH